MSTLNDKLNLIKDARDGIQTALAEKGQVVGKDIRDYAEAVANIDSGSGVLLFNTKQEMEDYETPQEGNLAIIYTEIIVPYSLDISTNKITLPKTVVLDTAVDSNFYVEFRGGADAYLQLSPSYFRFNYYMGDVWQEIEYTSSDGINYVREDEDTNNKVVEFSNELVPYSYEWSDNIGYFMLVDTTVYGGSYIYLESKWKNLYTGIKQYETVEQMEADTDVAINDNALVYYNRLVPISGGVVSSTFEFIRELSSDVVDGISSTSTYWGEVPSRTIRV